MNAISSILVITPDAAQAATADGMDNQTWYTIGAVIGFLLLIYLAFVLLKPEKF
ncbi:MAG TPA: K(+)-transporting ATPase subunit F [Bacteroidales bacterium]|nr:K(+)-transporting ATPase subunit F [Bacteroidales bacterium]